MNQIKKSESPQIRNTTNSARNRKRTLAASAPRRGLRPQLQRGGNVVIEEEPIPTISITKTFVKLDKIHTCIENEIKSVFASEDSINDLPPSENKFLNFYHLSVRGPRKSNEDEYVVIEHVNEFLGLTNIDDKYAYLAVYDGHSGKYTSLFTRSQLHYKLFSHKKFPEDSSFHDTFIETDKYVNEFQHRNSFSCGTTALSVCVKNNKELIIGNVGDCRGYLCRNGKPLEIANPHILQREDEKKRIESLGGAVVCYGTWRVNGILAVSRSIGDYNLRSLVIPDPDVTRFELSDDDEFLVIASDGLWDGINGEEMISIVKKTVNEQGCSQVCKTLCEIGIEKKTNDNVTVIVLFFNNEFKNVN